MFKKRKIKIKQRLTTANVNGGQSKAVSELGSYGYEGVLGVTLTKSLVIITGTAHI